MDNYTNKLKQKQEELSNLEQNTKNAVIETKNKDGRLYDYDALQNYQSGIDKKKLKYGNNGIEISVYKKELNLTNTPDIMGTITEKNVIKNNTFYNPDDNEEYVEQNDDDITLYKKKPIKKDDPDSFISIFLDIFNKLFDIEPDKDIDKNITIKDKFNNALKSVAKRLLNEDLYNNFFKDDDKEKQNKENNKMANKILKDKKQHGEKTTSTDNQRVVESQKSYQLPSPNNINIKKTGIQFIPIRAKKGHVAGVCIDNINKKITIFEPNGQSLNEIEAFRGANSKQQVLSKLFNNKDVNFLIKNGYQLCDGNRRCHNTENIKTLPKKDRIFDGGIAYSKRDNTTDSCAIYNKEFMEKMTKNFLIHENGKINDYQQILQETNNKIKNSAEYIMYKKLKATKERFDRKGVPDSKIKKAIQEKTNILKKAKTIEIKNISSKNNNNYTSNVMKNSIKNDSKINCIT